MTSERHTITVAHGDGIGPEIMAATLRVLEAAEAPLDLEPITIGLAADDVVVALTGDADGLRELLRRPASTDAASAPEDDEERP